MIVTFTYSVTAVAAIIAYIKPTKLELKLLYNSGPSTKSTYRVGNNLNGNINAISKI